MEYITLTMNTDAHTTSRPPRRMSNAFLPALFGFALLATVTTAQATSCPGNVCNLKIYGTITETSCDVESDNTFQTVSLGNVSIGAFHSVGNVSNPVPFHIKLKDCSDNISGGTIIFQGTPDDNNPDLLKLTQESGIAKGVGIEILDGSGGTPIPLGKATSTIPLTAGDNDLIYALRYKSTLQPVTAGTANAVMYYDLSYQ